MREALSPAGGAARGALRRFARLNQMGQVGIAIRTGVMGNDMSSANDMKAAEATYHSFIGLIKVAVPIIAIIAVIVVKLISS
jgi:hypothetical protein